MKVKFRHAVKAFQGKFKAEGLVYCRYNDGALYLVRKYPRYTPSDHNHEMGNAAKNMGKLFKSLSAEYKSDLKTYAALMSNYTDLSEKLPAHCYAHFTQMIWALKRKIPEIDLASLTIDEIRDNEYPVRTVAEAMEAGLLPAIPEGMMLLNKL